MDRELVAVVLAGGIGTRLYPAARSDRPKQFQSFGGDASLLETTVDRVAFADHTVVVTRAAFADRIPQHAPGAEVLVEPEPKDTGPALVFAAHRLADRAADSVLLCVPSDHFIDGAFEAAARRAVTVAADTRDLVTIGVDPTRPATGYGYIEPGTDHVGYYEVDRFVEKPPRSLAGRLVDAGALWNTGVFAWTPDALLREARGSPLDPLVTALDAGDPTSGFARVERTSIDYAVLERTDRAVVVPASFEWDDLGTWDAIARRSDAPLADELQIDSERVTVAGDHHVTTIGVTDLVVAAYDDRVLVIPKGDTERVREAVSILQRDGDL